MKVLGYSISAADNDSYMNSDQHEVNICRCLDFVKNRHLHLNPTFKLNKKNYDISYTWDDFLLVSDRFKQFCIDNKYTSVSFIEIPNYPTKHLMTVSNITDFDSARRETKFLEFSPECNEYNEVVGATPVCLTIDSPLTDNFFRTNIEFGRGYAKGPIILVGVETAIKLKAQKLKGLYLEKILAKYDWEKS
ncbi:hypothetical protein QEG73_00370 [Chitinophagaceae bacterium 26-R-25]|nr:hypothetical protein [Chitinophagaceae bacterium 26-R-25]